MAHGSRLTAHASRLARRMAHGQQKFGARGMIHEPFTINHRLINELFDYLLQVLGIRYYRRIPIPTPASAAPLGDTTAKRLSDCT